MSRAAELTEQLQRFGRRSAGSEAERLSAHWVAAQISADPRREATVETFWSRPSWPAAQAVHVAAAIIGSLLATTQSRAGAAVVFVALAAMLADWQFCRSPGRLLTYERASQNVVSTSSRRQRVRLILTANLDTGRIDPTHGNLLPGWLSGIAGLAVWALVIALLRVDGSRGTLIAVLQIAPTVGLIAAFSWLLVAAYPADNATGVATALALTRILDAAPPSHLGVDLVVTGAGTGDGIGLRRFLRQRRGELNVTNTVVLGIGTGEDPYFLTSDGPLLPLAFFGPLRRIAAESGELAPASSRSCSPALPARLAHLPALGIGGEPDALVEAALELIDGIDAYVGGLAAQQANRAPQSRRLGFGPGARDSRPRRLRIPARGTSQTPKRSDGRHRVVLGRPLPHLLGRQRKA